jgi:hypothetical protein
MASDLMTPPAPAGGMQQRVEAAAYRLRQFGRGLEAFVRPSLRSAGVAQAATLLPAEALSLFAALPVDAQRHSLAVLQSIADLTAADGGAPDRALPDADLAVAALLHDVGKIAAAQAGAPHGLWVRGPLVLAEALAPTRMAQAARDDRTTGWRYTLWVQTHHAEIGAAMAETAGCSARACWLIAHHGDASALGALAFASATPVDGAAVNGTGTPPDAALLDALRLLQWADNRN